MMVTMTNNIFWIFHGQNVSEHFYSILKCIFHTIIEMVSYQIKKISLIFKI